MLWLKYSFFVSFDLNLSEINQIFTKILILSMRQWNLLTPYVFHFSNSWMIHMWQKICGNRDHRVNELEVGRPLCMSQFSFWTIHYWPSKWTSKLGSSVMIPFITFLFIRITRTNKGINAINFMQPEMSIYWVCEIHYDINTKS